jgi:hypothetical protein
VDELTDCSMRWRFLLEPGRIRLVEVRNLIRITSMMSRGANALCVLAGSDTRRIIWAEQPIAPTPIPSWSRRSTRARNAEAMSGMGMETTRQSVNELAFPTADAACGCRHGSG